MNPKVDTYLETVGKWQKELELLRKIVLDCGLTESYKWMHPCYTYLDKNIVILHEFKEYCGISFFKGALMQDSIGLLIQPTEHIQSSRQMRFTDIYDIQRLETTLKAYIHEAIEIEKAGLKVKLKTTQDYEVPEELEIKFEDDLKFKEAFKNLTPGRQRGYLLHFSKPKQSKTRASRIEQCAKRIFLGKGLNDCICGLSKRMPNCDGSHKQLKKNN